MSRRLVLLACTVLAGGCSGAGGGPGAQGSSSGAGPSGGSLLFSCKNPVGDAEAALAPACVDYYANAGPAGSAIESSFEQTCTAGGGTISNTACPTAGAVGACIDTVAGASAYGVYAEEIFYSPGSIASVKQSCAAAGEPYVAVGLGGTGGFDGGGSGAAQTGAGEGGAGDVTGDAGELLATSVSVGDSVACAVTTTGPVVCWGGSADDQLGSGSTALSLVPVPVTGLSSGITELAVGFASSCAMTTSGAVCWGDNVDGQLGDGTTNPSLVPVAVTGLTTSVTSLSVGTDVACAIVEGAVMCWGGIYGFGTLNVGPFQVSGFTGTPTAVAAGANSACIIASGAVWCWGLNGLGILGDGTTTDSTVPVQVSGLTTAVTVISVGSGSACAVASGTAWCWGDDNAGQLGNGTIATLSSTPVAVTAISEPVSYVSVGLDFACALTMGGAVMCWGHNNSGQLGNGSMTTSTTPVAVTGLTSGVTALAAGLGSACAVTAAGNVLCWGDNSNGQLGSGTTAINSAVPVKVL